MRSKEVIYLLLKTITYDELLNQIETVTERMVYANELSISSGEFYEAAVVGLKPQKRFQIYSFEYAEETQLKHNNITYDIIQTQTYGEKLSLTCEKVASNG